jgi:lysophospholipase L1-like esterase
MKIRRSAIAPLCAVIAAVLAALVLAAGARADADSATHYYLSLGDSLAASSQPNGDFGHGYAEQLYAALVADDPKLELVKLGCGGESTASMRFGSQDPTVVLSCGAPHYYKHVLYPKGTQLAEALGFLEAHKSKVALVTIDIGANDLQRLDSQGNVVICLLEPAGCATQQTRLTANLSAILSDLRAAAGPDVPIVGMTYYNPFAPLWFTNPATALFVGGRVEDGNAVLASTYAAAGVPVADVAGAFENGIYPDSALNVCAWTWACSLGDLHANTAGYGVIAQAFEQALS